MPTTVVLGVIGSDAHVVGVTILERALDAAGFEVVNLGVQTEQAEFVAAATDHDADAILVSSLYGHAQQDCTGFHDRLETAGVDAVTYIGGNLAVGQDDFAQTRATFESLGFDRVFDPETDPTEAINALRRDLNLTTEPDRLRVTS
ncbi:methylaspartate mutase subunit S [Halovivax asiaticus JCM 14624]|uniref:Glutamate mutase sigma subunit n=1 Tax=Halovivax asiaticus JCM 14624 TaxID=1227490 RepID=M0BTF6_9EURY|nr:methylaspartate mutase subunit S [Halovivax asiaticus]ELZ14235.1 methylaspartate mutase subunit S [Halovivax asiaticus JCM 14624]